MTISLTVTCPCKGLILSLVVPQTCTIDQLKFEISSKFSIDFRHFRLRWQRKPLDSERTLSSYDIPDGSVLDVAPIAAIPEEWQFVVEHPQEYMELLKSDPDVCEQLAQNPAIVHLINDSEMLRERFAQFSMPGNAGHAARSADLRLTAQESKPGGVRAGNRELAEFESAAEYKGRRGEFGLETRIGPRAGRPSETPLAGGAAGPSQKIRVGQLLAELEDRGVKLAEIPGLEMLKELVLKRAEIAPETVAELEVRYRVQMKQLKSFGFTNTARNARALLDNHGNVGLALASLDG
jgi:hypothetical protein